MERNADVPPENRIEFRIGINVGDIIRDAGDIFGNGVNVAARLALLWQILSDAGFPNQFFCDSWAVGFWRADYEEHTAGLGN